MRARDRNKLGDKAIEPRLLAVMNALARGVDQILNPKNEPKRNGFVLLVFPLGGHEGRANYISNAERADVLALLKEQVARFEKLEGRANASD